MLNPSAHATSTCCAKYAVQILAIRLWATGVGGSVLPFRAQLLCLSQLQRSEMTKVRTVPTVRASTEESPWLRAHLEQCEAGVKTVSSQKDVAKPADPIVIGNHSEKGAVTANASHTMGALPNGGFPK